MTDILTTAETDVKVVEAQSFSAANDFKGLATDRIADALIAVIVIIAIWIGHAL